MARAIDLENAMDISTLYDWYITSVSQDDEPVWTEKHIDELFKDFYVIPKETPVIKAEPVKHGKWIDKSEWHGTWGVCRYECSCCGYTIPRKPFSRGDGKGSKYCDECGARMDGE